VAARAERGTRASLRATLAALRAGRASRRRTGDAADRLLSVVIPVYNVAEYLPDCLASVASQDHEDLQIVLVDDGSTDGSADILAEFVADEPRAVLVTKANAGLGAARNTGLAAATGAFVTFVDSDDVVLPGAYRAMIRTLRRSGSDFVVGCPQRMDDERTWIAPWARRLHEQDRIGITVEDMPGIVGDVFAWNKVFRRPFFDTVVGQFPEGIRYEDQEPSARAYLGAASLDVLRRVTYGWRKRTDGGSITQGKAELADLRDRSVVMRRVYAETIGRGPEAVRRAWLAKALGFDLRPYFLLVPRTDPAYWAALADLVGELSAHADADVWSAVGVNDRAIAWAGAHGDRDDVIAILTSLSALGHSFPVRSGSAGLVAQPPYLPALRQPLPERLRGVRTELALVTAVTGWRWRDEDTVVLRGHAYVEHLPDEVEPEGRPVVALELVERTSGEVRPLPVAPPEPGDPPLLVNDRWIAHAGARFRAEVDTRELRDGGVWQLRARVRGGGRELVGHVRDVSATDSSGRLAPGPVVAGRRIVAGLRSPGPGRGRVFVVSSEQPRWVPTAVAVAGDDVVLDLPGLPGGARWRGRDERSVAVAQTSTRIPGGVRVRVPLPEGHHDGTAVLELAEEGSSRHWHPVTLAHVADLAGEWALPATHGEVTVDGRGHLVLRPGSPVPRVADVAWDPAAEQLRITMTGPWAAEGPVAVALVAQDAALAPWPGRVVEGAPGLVAQFDLRDAAGRPPAPGDRYLTITAAGRSSRLAVARPFEAGLRREIRTPLATLVLTRTPRQGALRVRLRPPLADDERGVFARTRNEEAYRARVGSGELRRAVLFECFGGRFSGDSVRQISVELARSGRAEELGLELLWSVRDLSVPVPPGSRPVVRMSKEWFEALATSAWLVNNNNFPYAFRKAPGQVYVQTWHGTPLKRIGADVPAASLSLRYRELMGREAAAWDHLVAGNEHSAAIFARAFEYQGDILVTGYPRNDPLVGDTAVERAAVRAGLGLGPEQTFVLYTPTWRDTARDSTGEYALVSHLDLREWSARAPGTWVLGIRGHANVSGSVAAVPGVLDVTAYPDVADLYLAADVMVTDYSSTMFDFSVTGKPMVFLVPDLADYRDRVRGFYFDLAPVAPGPLVATTAQVVDAVAGAPGWAAAYADRYSAWRDRFNARDDGRAAARVVAAVWGAGAGPTAPGPAPSRPGRPGGPGPS
jgi:CDP-glycerol glycerophosphotransferase